MTENEFGAGPNQMVVVYVSEDTSEEIDPLALFGHIAADAEQRALAGCRIVSMAVMPLRHGGTLMNKGGGFQTKTSVAVVYATL
jgi:hypothetical protein